MWMEWGVAEVGVGYCDCGERFVGGRGYGWGRGAMSEKGCERGEVVQGRGQPLLQQH